MSREVERIFLNTIWRVEAKTPTYTRAGLKASFRNIDQSRLKPDQTSGLTRAFTLDWSGRGQYEELISASARFASHNFQLSLYYDFDTYTNYDLLPIIVNDVDDISRTLDNHAYWIGYNSSNTTTDIGLQNRLVTSVSKQSDDRLVIVNFDFMCLVREAG